MQIAALWKDDTLPSNQNQTAMLVAFPALTRPTPSEQWRYHIVKQIFFLHNVCMKALITKTIFSFWSGNHRGFQPHAGEKKKQIMGIFSEPCCLTDHLLDTRDWKEQEFPQSKRQLSPAAYNLFYSPLPDNVEEEQKEVLHFTHGKERTKCASCRGTKTDPLATFFAHMFILSFNSDTELKSFFFFYHSLRKA